jgi:hypothetical protein
MRLGGTLPELRLRCPRSRLIMVEDCQEGQAKGQGSLGQFVVLRLVYLRFSCRTAHSAECSAMPGKPVGTENLGFEADRPPRLRFPQTLLRFAFLAGLLTLGCLAQEVVCQRHQHAGNARDGVNRK